MDVYKVAETGSEGNLHSTRSVMLDPESYIFIWNSPPYIYIYYLPISLHSTLSSIEISQ